MFDSQTFAVNFFTAENRLRNVVWRVDQSGAWQLLYLHVVYLVHPTRVSMLRLSIG